MISHSKITVDASMISKVECNMCGNTVWDVGQKIAVRADFLSVNMLWSRNSNKEGQEDHWDLCEECYDKLVLQFKVPITTATPTDAEQFKD